MRVACGCVASMLLASATASPLCAAEIRAIHGTILANSGSGFRSIEQPTALEAGDAVFAAPQGLGRLTFDDGCIVAVVPGSITWIRARSPCAAGFGAVTSRDPEPKVTPSTVFDPAWLVYGAALLDPRKPPAGQ